MFHAEITRSIAEARRQGFEQDAIQHNLVKAIRRGQVAVGGRVRRQNTESLFRLLHLVDERAVSKALGVALRSS
jgi:hypothetical protein